MSPVLKLSLAIVGIIVLLPIAMSLVPKPNTLASFRDGFTGAKMQVDNYEEFPQPQLESIAQAGMYVNGNSVQIYQFGNEGKISKQLEYHRPDAGQAMVDTFNLAQSIGAAPNRNAPMVATRNGMFLLIATGPDKAQLKEIERVFQRQ
jgi:hypothetical protein